MKGKLPGILIELLSKDEKAVRNCEGPFYLQDLHDVVDAKQICLSGLGDRLKGKKLNEKAESKGH